MTCKHVHVPTLTCHKEVGEDQDAAAAEADQTVGGHQNRQGEETKGHFTYTQRCRCSQHTVHGSNRT